MTTRCAVASTYQARASRSVQNGSAWRRVLSGLGHRHSCGDDTVLADRLWLRLQPLLPVRQRRFRHPGRLRTPDRAALEGILSWPGPVSLGTTCPPRCSARRGDVLAAVEGVVRSQGVAAATRAGAGRATRRGTAGPVGGDRGPLASAGVQRGPAPVPARVDRGRLGSKHLITDAAGIPHKVTVAGGNRNDVTQLIALADGGTTDPGSCRPPGPATGSALRRPRLRQRQVSPHPACRPKCGGGR